jgi:acetone carboxylase gamma subunit
VTLADGGAAVDAEATADRRRAAREQRLGGRPRVDVDGRHDVPATPFRISEYLQLTGDRSQVQCRWCGEAVCDLPGHWKDAAVQREQPYAGTEAPPSGEEYVLRSYFCPACGTALEVEGCRRGDEPLRDVISDWPSS